MVFTIYSLFCFYSSKDQCEKVDDSHRDNIIMQTGDDSLSPIINFLLKLLTQHGEASHWWRLAQPHNHNYAGASEERVENIS